MSEKKYVAYVALIHMALPDRESMFMMLMLRMALLQNAAVLK